MAAISSIRSRAACPKVGEGRPRGVPLLAALEAVVTAVNWGDHEIPWLLSGPGLVTRALARHLAISGAMTGLPAGLALLDQRALNQAVAPECFATYKVYKIRSKKRGDAACL